jgi:hypothetical protein
MGGKGNAINFIPLALLADATRSPTAHAGGGQTVCRRSPTWEGFRCSLTEETERWAAARNKTMMRAWTTKLVAEHVPAS